MLGGKGEGGGGRDYDQEYAERGGRSQPSGGQSSSGGGFSGSSRASSHLDDDIPFAPEWR